jgi:hypothetical protein
VITHLDMARARGLFTALADVLCSNRRLIMSFRPELLTVDTAKRMGTRLNRAFKALFPDQRLSRAQTLDLVAASLGFDHWHEAQKTLSRPVQRTLATPEDWVTVERMQRFTAVPLSQVELGERVFGSAQRPSLPPPCLDQEHDVIVARADGQLWPTKPIDLKPGQRLYTQDSLPATPDLPALTAHQVALPDTITVADLALLLAVKMSSLMKALAVQGIMATVNQALTQGQATALVWAHAKEPVDAITRQILHMGRPEDQVFRSAFEQWWHTRSTSGAGCFAYDVDRWAYHDPRIHHAFEGYVAGQRQCMAALRFSWNDAYAAFVGAFDTPSEHLKRADAYSADARDRLRHFNGQMNVMMKDARLASAEEVRNLTANCDVRVFKRFHA